MNHVFRGNIFSWNLQLHLLALHVLDILRNFPKQVKDERWSRKRYDAWKSLVRLFCFRGERAQLCFERKRLRIVLAENWRGLEKGKRIESIERTWTFLRVSCNKVDDTSRSYFLSALHEIETRQMQWLFVVFLIKNFKPVGVSIFVPNAKIHYSHSKNSANWSEGFHRSYFHRFIRIEEIWFFFRNQFLFLR